MSAAQDAGLASCERALAGELPKALAAALAGIAEEHIDLDALLAIAATARTPPPPAAAAVPDAGAREADAGAPAEGVPAGLGAGEPWPRVRIGVARDAAFGFYYAECVLSEIFASEGGGATWNDHLLCTRLVGDCGDTSMRCCCQL